MPARQLNIRSDDAAERAARLAKALGQTTTRVVEDALRAYEAKTIPEADTGRSPEQQRRLETLARAVAEIRSHIRPDADWDDSWMYDENGLPK